MTKHIALFAGPGTGVASYGMKTQPSYKIIHQRFKSRHFPPVVQHCEQRDSILFIFIDIFPGTYAGCSGTITGLVDNEIYFHQRRFFLQPD